MSLSVSTAVAVIVLLISISAIYNAFLLRGGRLAWVQILIVLGMVSFLLFLVFEKFLPDLKFVGNLTFTDVFFVLGFALLLIASLKLHLSLK